MSSHGFMIIFLLLACSSVAALPPLVVWKCIHYRPTPLGGFVRSGLGDLYRDTFSAHFERDMPLIANTGANCLFLDEWDASESHEKFLRTAARNGLFVAPVFGLNSDDFPDLHTSSAQQYVLDKFDKFAKPLARWSSAIGMIRLGDGVNRNRSQGGYQPITAFTSFLPRLAAVRDLIFGRSPKIPFMVPMRSADVGIATSLAQIFSVQNAPVDYWGLDASTDWRVLNTIPANNLTKLIITLEMTHYDRINEVDQESSQYLGLQRQYLQLQQYGESSVVGLTLFEWHDVNARRPTPIGLSSEVFPAAILERRNAGITRQVFAQGRDCLRPRMSYHWIATTYGGSGWRNPDDLRCYPLTSLLSRYFIFAAIALGFLGVIIYVIGTCCIVRQHTKNAHVRYIPLAPDSRTDPYMVGIQSSLDSLLDAVLSGSMSMSLELLTANIINNINLVQASLLKMVTNRRTKDAVEMRCESLRKMAETLKIYARLALAERPGDLEEDEKLQAQTAEEVQRAQRDVKRVMAQMREELLELERLRDSDVRVEYGLSLRILGSDKAPPPAWKPVRLASSMSQSSPKPQRRQSKTSLNV